MKIVLLYFCSLLFVFSMTACESDTQSIYSEVPPPISAEPTEKPVSGIELNDPLSTQENGELTLEPTLPPQQDNAHNEQTTERKTTGSSISEPPDNHTENEMIDLVITVGNKDFAARLFRNASTQVLLELMPMTLDMNEMNGNEKYHFLSAPLPTASESIGNIQNGDFMLYGSDCLVLFYEDFHTTYSYTKLGYIVDVSGLSDELGSNDVKVSFNIVND